MSPVMGLAKQAVNGLKWSAGGYSTTKCEPEDWDDLWSALDMHEEVTLEGFTPIGFAGTTGENLKTERRNIGLVTKLILNERRGAADLGLVRMNAARKRYALLKRHLRRLSKKNTFLSVKEFRPQFFHEKGDSLQKTNRTVGRKQTPLEGKLKLWGVDAQFKRFCPGMSVTQIGTYRPPREGILRLD